MMGGHGRKGWLGRLAVMGLAAGALGVGCGGDDSTATTTVPDAGVASADAGSGPSCAAPATLCGSTCVDTKNDPTNCGGCGNACPAGQACVAGQCALSCAGGTTKCGTTCADTKVDGANCGACGTKCEDGLVCSNGACALDCGTDLMKCGGSGTKAFCASVKTDSANCGTCGNACAASEKCVNGVCDAGCATSADCSSAAAKCAGGVCTVPADCAEIKLSNPLAPSGKYTIDPDGAGGVTPFSVWCDMTTDGGGWTIVASHSGADGEESLVSNTEVTGDALSFKHSNLSRAQKMALSALETESIFVKNNGQWLRADKPMFDANLDTADTNTANAVKIVASDGTATDAFMGYSNHDIAGGGDFGISMSPDGATCNGNTTDGFDHHSTNYFNLNCGCQRQYLYSFSNAVQDGDAGYDVNTGLGSWTATAGCGAGEGGALAFYSAMRRRLTDHSSCSELHTAYPTLPSGWYLVDRDKAGATYPAVPVYCDMATDGGGYTYLPINGGISTTMRTEANSCQPLGFEMAVPRTYAHLAAMWNLFGSTYFATIPGIYGLAGGDYTGCAMNSGDATCADNWKSIDGKAWFLYAVSRSEPNGDYDPDCWLGRSGGLTVDGLLFNDAYCNYATGTKYLCSDNVK